MRRIALVLCLPLAYAACGNDPDATRQRIAADTAMAGQLYCQYGPLLTAVSGVRVTDETAAKVAAMCASIVVPGVPRPVALPVPVSAPLGSTAIVVSAPVR